MATDPFTQGVTIGGEITASGHNDAWDNLEAYLNARLGAAASAGYIPIHDGTKMVWKAVSGGATLASSGVLTIADAVVTSRKLKPTVDVKLSNSVVAPASTSYEDYPGTTLNITPSVASNLVVIVNAGISAAAAGADIAGIPGSGTISVDGTDETSTIVLNYEAQFHRSNITDNAEMWLESTAFGVFPLTAAPHTIKGRVAKATSAATAWSFGRFSYLYLLVAS